MRNKESPPLPAGDLKGEEPGGIQHRLFPPEGILKPTLILSPNTCPFILKKVAKTLAYWTHLCSLVPILL